MAITILPRAGSAGSEIAGQFGQGVSSGLQALANMKMQEYANKQMYKQQQEAQEQQYKQAEAALDSIGQGQYKPFVRIPGGMKLMESLALGGWNPQAQQTGQPGSIQQTMNTLQPDQDMGQYLGFNPKPLPSIADFMGGQQAGMQAQAPTAAPSSTGMQPTADLGQALRQAAMNKPEIVAADRRQKEHEEFLAKENEKKQQARTKSEEIAAQRQEDKEIRQNNAKFRSTELPVHQAYQHVGNLAKKAQKIIDQYGAQFPKGISKYSPAQWQKVLIQNPAVRNYMGLLQDIVLEKLKGMKGQPRQWEAELINNTKAWIDQPIETQKMRLQQLVEDAAIDAHRLSYENTLDRRKGRPVDLVKGMQTFEQVQIDPLASPEPYKVGTILPAKYSPNGKRNKVVMVNGEKQFEELP